MKKRIPAYTFSPGGAGAGTITFTGYTTILKDGILLVVNTTTGATLYNFADPTRLGTVATNVLTLAVSTTGQSSGDKLAIWYDDADPTQQIALSTAGVNVFSSMSGEMSVSMPPTTLFADAFDGSVVDTTTTWTTQVGSGGSVTQATGTLTVTAGVTGSAYAAIFSKNIFTAPGAGAIEPSFRIAIENPVKANVKRFWGMGTVPATPTVAIPVTEGIGFELTEAGVFKAVIYKASAIVDSAVLTAPVDGALHLYYIHYVSGYYVFYSDANYFTPLALLATDPGNNSLPLAIVAVNGSTPPSAGQSLTSSIAIVSDYGKNTQQIGDGRYPWIKSTVKPGSTPPVLTDPALVVSLSPNRGQTYRASTIVPLVAAVTVNVPFFNIIGSATKTVTVKRITVSGMTQTAVGYFPINVERLSTASTGGTSTTLVATTSDTTNAAVTAVVKAYTAAPTKGTLVGTLRSYRALWQATTAAAGGSTDSYDFLFGDLDGSGGVVLRGTAQELALTFPVVLASAGTLAIDIMWTEE